MKPLSGGTLIIALVQGQVTMWICPGRRREHFSGSVDFSS